MKKKQLIFKALLFACLAALTLAVAGCAKKIGGGGEYGYTYEQEFTDPHDADMKIDGRLTESRWQDKTRLTHTQDGVTVRYTSALTDMGVYFAAEAEDTDIKWTARLDFANNSCFTVFVTRDGQRSMHPMRVLRFDVDSRNSRSYNQNRFEAKAAVEGEINSGKTVRMTAELFVSWKSLNIDVSAGIPEAVRICPYYRKITEANSADNKNIFSTFTWTERPANYLRFGANGYVNPDREGAVVGDGANGMAKSDGWDISRESEGVVRSVAENSQAIFFKGIESDNYDLRATVRPVGAIRDTAPHIGLVTLSDEINLRTFYLSANDILSGGGTVRARNLTLYPEGGWHETEYLSAPASGTGSETVRLIKRGASFYYFIGDKLVKTEQVDNLAGKAVPGLFSLGCEAVFADYSVKDYQSDPAALDAVLSEYVYTVAVPGYISGGSVTASAAAVVKGGAVTIDVAPRPGYMLSAFTLNGADALSALRSGIRDGKYVIDAVREDLTVEAAFAKLPKTARVTGRLKGTGGGTVPNGSVSAAAEGESLIYYRTGTASNGSFAVDLAPAGAYGSGGAAVTLSGKYTLVFEAEGLRRKEIEITVTEAVSLGEVTLDRAVLGGSASLGGGTKFLSDLRGWDMSAEHLGEVTARGGSNGSRLYFTDVSGSRAVVEYTVENRTPEGEGFEDSPGVGITFAQGGRSLLVLAVDSRILILPNGVWEDGTFYDNAASYDLRRKNEPFTFRFVKDDAYLAVYLAGSDGSLTELYRGEQPLLKGECAFAVTVTQTFDCAVRVSDYSARAGEDADETVNQAFYRAVTLGDYDEAQGSVTVSETGLVRIGSEISVRVNTAASALVRAGGRAFLLEGGGVCAFTVTEDVVIDVEFYERLCELSGQISAAAALGRQDLSDTVLTATRADGICLVFGGAVNADGTYSVKLSAGEYTVELSHAAFLPVSFAVTAAGGTSKDAEFLSSGLTDRTELSGEEIRVESAEFTVDAAAQSVTARSLGRGANNRKFFAASPSEAFVAETVISRFDRSDDEWAAAGIYLAGGGSGYGVYLCDPDCDGNLFLCVNGIEPWYVSFMTGGFAFGDDGVIKLKTVLYERKLFVFADGALALTLDAHSLAAPRNAHTDPDLTGTAFPLFAQGFFDGRIAAGLGSVAANVTFTTPVFSSDESYLQSQPIFAALDAVEDGCEIAFAYEDSGLPAEERVKLGDRIRVSVTAPEGKIVAAVTAGEPLTLSYADEKRTATAVFTASGDVTVTAYITDRTVPLSGRVTAPVYYDANLSETAVTAVDPRGFGYPLAGSVDETGGFTAELPPDEYTFTVSHPLFEDLVVTASVAAGGGAIPDFAFARPRLSGDGWTLSDGKLIGVTGQTRMFVGAEGVSVMAEATVATTVTDGGWSTGGVAVQTDLDGEQVELRILPLFAAGKVNLLFINQAGGWGFRTYATPYEHESCEQPLSMRVAYAEGRYYVTLGKTHTVVVGYDTPFLEQYGDGQSRHAVFFENRVKQFGLCVQDGVAAFTDWAYAADAAQVAAMLPNNPFSELGPWHFASGALVSPETASGVNSVVPFRAPAAAAFSAETTFRVDKSNGGWAAGGIYLTDGTHGMGVYVVAQDGKARLLLISYDAWDADSFGTEIPYTVGEEITLRVELAGGRLRTFISGTESQTIDASTGIVTRQFPGFFDGSLGAGLVTLESRTQFSDYAYHAG